MISEAEAVAQLGKLAVGERDGTMDKAVISIGPFSAYVLISAIQMVMRHGGMEGGPTVGVLASLRDQFLVLFPEGGPIREILAMGMDPERDVPIVDTTTGSGPALVPCPECGGQTWHRDPSVPEDSDEHVLACKQCGHTISLEQLMHAMGLAGDVIEMPLVEIPMRTDKGDVNFPCQICDGTLWRPVDGAYGCNQCRTVYSRETILGLMDAMITMAAEDAESKTASDG